MIFDNSSENPIDFKAKFIGMMPTIMISLMLGASIQYLIDDSTFDLKEYFYIVEKILSDQL